MPRLALLRRFYPVDSAELCFYDKGCWALMQFQSYRFVPNSAIFV